MDVTHLSCEDDHAGQGADRRAAGEAAAPRAGEATFWNCGDVRLDLRRTRVMGVLNVTPDSFSDGGAHAGEEEAVAWGMSMLDQGADILDVGGESTRPGFTPVDPDEECRRVVPVVRRLAQAGALVSVDTRHAQVAREALAAGARILNDVSGFTDPEMLGIAAASDCGVVCMWAGPGSLDQGSAAVAADYLAPLADLDAVGDGARADETVAQRRARLGRQFVGGVCDFLLAQARALQEAGVAASRICLDPGVGFGTTFEQDLALQREMRFMSRLGYPLLCAVSRKRSIGVMSGENPASARDAASIGGAVAAMTRGCRVLRVHDVAGTSDVFRVAEASWGKAGERDALVALGSNVGDRVAELRGAVADLDELPLTHVVRASDAVESEPAYLDDQPAFANAVVLIRTELHPLALLPLLQGIEGAHGRVRTVPNGPRTLDVDLLWMEGESHGGDLLRLPHPRMGERDFVLTPMAEVLGGRQKALDLCRSCGVDVLPDDRLLGRVTATLGALR